MKQIQNSQVFRVYYGTLVTNNNRSNTSGKKTSKQAVEQVFNNRSLTHCLICCPVEIVGEALESGSGIPEKQTYPDKNRERLTLCVIRKDEKITRKSLSRRGGGGRLLTFSAFSLGAYSRLGIYSKKYGIFTCASFRFVGLCESKVQYCVHSWNCCM